MNGLKAWRKARGMTQSELAASAGVTKAQVWRAENQRQITPEASLAIAAYRDDIPLTEPLRWLVDALGPDYCASSLQEVVWWGLGISYYGLIDAVSIQAITGLEGARHMIYGTAEAHARAFIESEAATLRRFVLEHGK